MNTETARSETFEALIEFIRRERGFDFAGYKRPSLMRRIRKRMHTVGLDDFAEYGDYLSAHPDEFAALFDTILINVTSFFRDAPAWSYVAETIVPQLLADKPANEAIRVWSTGCATGEEAFTATMVLAGALGDDAFRARVKIYATDVDEEALSTGRHAVYTEKDVAPVPEDLRERYFERHDHRYTFRSDLRRCVIFGRHDLLQDPPISRIDLLLARNTLMYFTHEAQSQVLADFHFALNPSGYLFLGKSEMLLSRSSLFTPVDLKSRVFRPAAKTSLRDRLLHIVEAPVEERGAADPRMRDSAFESSPLAQLVVERDGGLTHANLQARVLFGIGQRDIGRPFRDLELSYRPVDLRTPIDQVNGDRQTAVVRDVAWPTPSGEPRFFDVHVIPLGIDSEGPLGVAVAFTDTTRYRKLHENVERSRRELETAYEELQSTAEELETTNEELHSTNEELETTNEELQSTNEELETMNEELQSTNEELETLNDELRLRGDDLGNVNVFLESILGSLEAGVVVVDTEFRIQAWNDLAAELWGLRAEEVEGSQLLSLEIGLPVDELAKPLRRALSGERTTRLTIAAVNRRGRAITCAVTLKPLRSPNGQNRGVILLIVPEEASPSSM